LGFYTCPRSTFAAAPSHHPHPPPNTPSSRAHPQNPNSVPPPPVDASCSPPPLHPHRHPHSTFSPPPPPLPGPTTQGADIAEGGPCGEQGWRARTLPSSRGGADPAEAARVASRGGVGRRSRPPLLSLASSSVPTSAAPSARVLVCRRPERSDAPDARRRDKYPSSPCIVSLFFFLSPRLRTLASNPPSTYILFLGCTKQWHADLCANFVPSSYCCFGFVVPSHDLSVLALPVQVQRRPCIRWPNQFVLFLLYSG
jgi:hypothetical protein